LPELRPHERLRVWLPVVAWAALISLLSSALFSGEHTGVLLLPLLQALFPTAGPEHLQAVHLWIRKGAHVTEYLVLAVLLVRALRTEGLRGGALAAAAMLIGVAYAALDETHQAFVPSRTASAGDVAVDAIGVLAGVGLAVARRPAGPSPATAVRPVEN
jgi:VanZ family protein